MRRTLHALPGILAALSALILLSGIAYAQGDASDAPVYKTKNIVVPQQKSYPVGKKNVDQDRSSAPAPALIDGVAIDGIEADIRITDRTAITTLTISLAHPDRRLPARIMPETRLPFSLLIPIPERAQVEELSIVDFEESLTFDVLSGEQAARALRETAGQIGSAEVLEFAGTKAIVTSELAMHSGDERTFRLVYREELSANGNRIDYVLPRSESFAYRSILWRIDVTLEATSPIGAIYSPSHTLSAQHSVATQATVSVKPSHPGLPAGVAVYEDRGLRSLEPGAFRLSYITGDELSASFMAYPGNGQEGCFLMIAGASHVRRLDNGEGIGREVIIVIDRSGSMDGEKIEQARDAAVHILKNLRDGEAFNVIIYDDVVESFAMEPKPVTSQNITDAIAYVHKVESNASTNIHDALVKAMEQKHDETLLPIVIFLTDGVPTAGITDERGIRDGVAAANVHDRRIFTLGVGYDVNAPLLEAIANDSRASTTFVLPGEKTDEKVRELFAKLNGPIFADVTLAVTTPDGRDASSSVRDLFPARLGDLYEGNQLNLFGKYTITQPLIFTLSGTWLGAPRSFSFTFDPNRDASLDAPFVCRLWATQQVMQTVDSVSRSGAKPASERTEEDEVQLKKWTKEIIDLSKAHGIITEYTADLADASNVNVSADSMVVRAEEKLKTKAQNARSGKAAVSQVMNKKAAKEKGVQMNRANSYVDDEMNVVEVVDVQQIHNRSFFRRGDRWVEGNLLDNADSVVPSRTLRLGTPEFDAFVAELATLGEQGIFAMSGTVLMTHGREIVQIETMPDIE